MTVDEGVSDFHETGAFLCKSLDTRSLIWPGFACQIFMFGELFEPLAEWKIGAVR